MTLKNFQRKSATKMIPFEVLLIYDILLQRVQWTLSKSIQFVQEDIRLIRIRVWPLMLLRGPALHSMKMIQPVTFGTHS